MKHKLNVYITGFSILLSITLLAFIYQHNSSANEPFTVKTIYGTKAPLESVSLTVHSSKESSTNHQETTLLTQQLSLSDKTVSGEDISINQNDSNYYELYFYAGQCFNENLVSQDFDQVPYLFEVHNSLTNTTHFIDSGNQFMNVNADDFTSDSNGYRDSRTGISTITFNGHIPFASGQNNKNQSLPYVQSKNALYFTIPIKNQNNSFFQKSYTGTSGIFKFDKTNDTVENIVALPIANNSTTAILTLLPLEGTNYALLVTKQAGALIGYIFDKEKEMVLEEITLEQTADFVSSDSICVFTNTTPDGTYVTVSYENKSNTVLQTYYIKGDSSVSFVHSYTLQRQTAKSAQTVQSSNQFNILDVNYKNDRLYLLERPVSYSTNPLLLSVVTDGVLEAKYQISGQVLKHQMDYSDNFLIVTSDTE